MPAVSGGLPNDIGDAAGLCGRELGAGRWWSDRITVEQEIMLPRWLVWRAGGGGSGQ